MKNFTRSLLLVFLLPYLLYSQVECPKLNGGYRKVTFLNSQQHLYPSLLPTGAPKDAKSQHTAGHIVFPSISFEEKTPSIITFYPTQDGTTYGYIQLLFTNLDFKEDTYLRIYNGTSYLGTPGLEINYSNFSSLVGTTYMNDGPITLVFFGKTTEEKFGNYIRYVTGDVKLSSCTYGRESLIWKSYSPSNAYTVIDNMESATFNFMNDSHKLPVCMAYFNSAGDFVSSELAYSLDKDKIYPTVSDGYYPGEIIFEKPTSPLDIDRSGSADATDMIKLGRVLYIINKANLVPQNSWNVYQNGVWTTINSSTLSTFDSGSIEEQAKNANPAVLSTSHSFIFDVTPTGSNTKTINDYIYIDIEYSPYYLHPAAINFNFPSQIHTSVQSGGNINNEILNLTNASSGTYTAQIKVTSSVPGTYSLMAYLEPDLFFKLDNMSYYAPCNASFSRFIALHPDEPTIISNNVSVTFMDVATPVTLSEFKAERNSQQAILTWTTLEETNFSHFEIEKSIDLNNWQKIGEVISNGEGLYQFSDYIKNTESTVYYRLKMVDHDETFSYSNIRVISAEPTAFKIYPNPTTENLYFSYSEDIKNARIFDGKGNFVLGLPETQLLHGVPVSHLNAGMYFLQIITKDGRIISEKFIIQK